MQVYGLVGFPLSHSFSEKYFAEKFRKEGIPGERYKLFPLQELDSLPGLLKDNPDLAGFNVTIPYKEKIIPFLDQLVGDAAAISAVNTVKIVRSDAHFHLTGYNTDAEGFKRSADFTGHRKALVLGSGGASRAVQFALKKMGIEYVVVSRSKKEKEFLNYHELTRSIIEDHTLIINATPSGMFPDVTSFPDIPYEFLSEVHFLYDLVYNPGMTEFLKKGKQHGCRIQNGHKMLEIQAELSYNIWEKGSANSD